ncbi:MAG: HNH endonuclease [Rhodospirillales bacterium 20-60-12]|nr:MAG: HNH endonuclease [Rhodospirillales bacterium 20-60-12]
MPDGGQHHGGQHFPALVLNADFRPLSYFPLSLWGWQDAVKAVFLDRVCVLSEYEREVHSVNFSMRLPSVIALKDFIPTSRQPAFTRFNVFLRDSFSCQYCAAHRPAQELTFDHVIPRARGGRTTWENVVAACGPCNLRKGSKLPREIHMHPRLTPRRPTSWELQDRGRAFPPNYLHESWRDFLYWDSELES